MIGTTLAHYRITAALGAGGMGEVWRARDEKLGREVALKVLSEEFAGDADRLERFEREARAVAALNHPHIVTIFSVEDADGVRFLTMELVEGRTLDKMIPENGFDAETFFELATPLAEAISAAHDKSVIHRDLKPSNVMVDGDGRVKVLDFGLAKLQSGGESSDSSEMPTEALTGVGMVVGTVPYMSPEQIEGKIVDHRTDVFSLGVLLYEMATGERPFSGDSQPALMSSILRDVPQSVLEVRDDIPRHLGRIVARCLEKDRRDRYQTARDVFYELRTLQREASSMGTAGTRRAAARTRTAPRASSHTAASSSAVKTDEGFWVAVLPFKYAGGDEDLVALAEGLSEDIVTGLSRFSYLRVIARGSTLKYASEGLDVRAVGEELGARYVMEGSLRRAGKKLRLAVQLVDTDSGAHLWAEAYDRGFDAEDLFAMQDELVPTIVSTVADTHGVLPRSMGEALRSCSPGDLTPYEAVLRSFSYFERVTAEELAAARAGLDLAVQKAPDSADAWAMMALLCAQEHGQGFKLLDDPLEIGAAAARRAVEVGPSNHLAHFSLAQVLFFQKDYGTFRNTAARAAELNPMDGNSIAFLGELLTYAGDSERGLELAGRAKRLNPNHPGWYWYADFFHAYRELDYPAALAVAQKVNLPDHWGQHVATAIAYGQLGDRRAAGKALKRLVEIRPDFARIARQEFEKWWDSEFVEHMVDGLRKAGLEMPQESESVFSTTAAEASRSPDSGAARADEGFWIAVLPFGCPGGDAEIEAFADGLEEDIASGLSRFSYLFVVARKSTRRYRGEAIDVRQVAEELGVRYVMEGGIRRAGSRIRIGMNLIDAATGTHLWSETYDRDLGAADVFELQDEITGRIVATAADSYGILVHSIEAGLQDKAESEYAPWEWLIRLFGYRQRPTPAEHSRLRDSLEEAVDRDPNVADAWACLSQIYLDEHGFGFNARPDAPNRALSAAQRAVDLDRSSQLGYQVLAQSQFFRRDLKAFRSAADRAMSLNPRDSNSIGILGLLIVLSGEFEAGAEISRRAMDLNPNHAGWYHFGPIWESFHNRDHEKALEHAKQVNMPGMSGQHLAVAAACGHLGRRAEGEAAVADLLAHDPDIASTLRQNLEIWHFASGLVEPLMEGLGKAGLKVAPVDGAPGSAVARSGARKTVGIAVLPFSDLSPAKDQDYFCEGMAEEIMNALVRIEGILVASRTSAFRARQEGHGLAEIARLLSVGHVLEGSVRTAGSRLRVTAQLTDVASGYQLWSERFDRKLEDVFAVQDEIAAGVVEAVEARLAPGARTIPIRPQPHNLEAYRSYLLGQHLRYAKEDHGGAVRAFQEAVRLDPTHAPSWTGLAESLALSAHMSLIPAHEACTGARKALSTAMELQGESADSLHGEAFVAFIERRWNDLEAAVRRAIELQPSHVPSLGLLGMCLSLHQKPDEAESFFGRARQADPLASFPYMLTALGLLTVRRPQEAHGYAEQALTFEKDDASALFCSSLANIALGHFEEGIEAAEHGVAVSHRGGDFLGLLGWALASAGREDEARTLLEELRARPETAPQIVSEGWLLGALGEIDAAFEVFAMAEDQHQLWLYYTGLPGFDPLRSDSRFPAFVERLGLPPSPAATIRTDASEEIQTTEKSIAVLPFVNMSDDRDNQYFSDGLSEEIINALTRIPNLRVIARTSAFRFRGERDLRAVGETLGVRNVLEGSVRRAGEQLRISAQLIDVADDSHIWSERFDREMTDVFEIQDEIADAIVNKLHVSFGSSVPVRRQTENVAAYEALLEGRHHFFQFTPKAAERALVCLRRALSLEPDYPDALMEHGFYHLMMAYMFADPRDALPHVSALAERALQLDPGARRSPGRSGGHGGFLGP